MTSRSATCRCFSAHCKQRLCFTQINIVFFIYISTLQLPWSLIITTALNIYYKWRVIRDHPEGSFNERITKVCEVETIMWTVNRLAANLTVNCSTWLRTKWLKLSGYIELVLCNYFNCLLELFYSIYYYLQVRCTFFFHLTLSPSISIKYCLSFTSES